MNKTLAEIALVVAILVVIVVVGNMITAALAPIIWPLTVALLALAAGYVIIKIIWPGNMGPAKPKRPPQ